MNVAVISFHEGLSKNRLFDNSDEITHHDNLMVPYAVIKQKLAERNVSINTIDMYDNLDHLDVVLFFKLDYNYLLKLFGKNTRLFYFAWEPEVVDSKHSIKSLNRLIKYFDAIFTWNDELVDNKRFYKINYPYFFNIESEIPTIEEFNNRKFLVNISSNKISFNRNELYSLRAKVIAYFEKKAPFKFELYGGNWPKLKVYKGKCSSKREVYRQFKFALSLENMQNVDGYITEKIFDCFTAGIVPIYWGARNVCNYIPDGCYIPFRFGSIAEMETYLNEITYEQYLAYLGNIKLFLQSKSIDFFKEDFFIKQFLYCLDSVKQRSYINQGKKIAIHRMRLSHWFMRKPKALLHIVFKKLSDKQLLR